MKPGRMARLRDIYARYDQDPAFDRLRTEHGPKRIVPGRGRLHPRLVFVGEAPGESEAVTGHPFAGPAGVVLDKLLHSIGLRRSDIWLTNVVKYRPTIGTRRVRNRTPSPNEVRASQPYLVAELNVFYPTPVVVMGSTSLRAVDPRKSYISDWHGRGWTTPRNRRRFAALYHPAVAVYDPAMMDTLRNDMRCVLDLLRERPHEG